MIGAVSNQGRNCQVVWLVLVAGRNPRIQHVPAVEIVGDGCHGDGDDLHSFGKFGFSVLT